MSHTINVTDLADQNAVHRILSDIQHHGTSYALVQEGVEVAKVVPIKDEATLFEDHDGMTPEELAKHRLEVLERIKVFSKKVAKLYPRARDCVPEFTFAATQSRALGLIAGMTTIEFPNNFSITLTN